MSPMPLAMLLDVLVLVLGGAQALGLTLGLAALAAAGCATLLSGRIEVLHVEILANPIVRGPLVRVGLALTAVGMAAYAALEAAVRWWPY